MEKKTKALSGASQDAYFRRVLKEQPSLGADGRERLVRRLRQEIAQLRLRRAVGADTQTSPPSAAAEALPPVPASPPFDPLSPNVIVVLRKSGRESALAALGMIESPDDLRLLAREQRLAVGAGLSSAAELRAAIVTAAERRIANRMAAAS
jgi:hypothetical protein